jgi:multisubunit Na+/H+ antiporter MnhC subunit
MSVRGDKDMNRGTKISSNDAWIAAILLGFLVAFFGAATVFQLRSDEVIWMEGSPLDIMHGSILWMAASTAMMVGVLRLGTPRLAVLWLLGAAVIGVVALDELFMLHEHSVKLTGDDDHPKMLLIASAGIGIFVLTKVETLRGIVIGLLLAGFAAHVFYLIMDMGDGDYFQVPLANHVHRTLEEYFEMIASAFYFSAFFFHAATLATSVAVAMRVANDDVKTSRIARAA